MDAYSVRLFCRIDDSAIGKLSLQYMDGLLLAGFNAHPVGTSLMAPSKLAACGWDRHEQRLLRYATGRFVNVVLGSAMDWRRCWTQKAPSSSSMGCLANIVVCAEVAPHAEYLIPGQAFGPIKQEPRPLRDIIALYDAAILPTEEISASWRSLHPRVHVIPPADADALRSAIEGALS